MAKLKKGHSPNYIFLISTWILVAIGIVMLSSASSDLGKIKFNDTYYYLKHQIMYGLSLGIIGFFLMSKIYYKNVEKAATILLALNIILLILVFSPIGIMHKGSSRWLDIGPLSIQPAELLKITFITYVAAWLSKRKITKQTSFKDGLLPLVIISALVAFLILIQPATTTLVIIMFSMLAVLFVSGSKITHIAGIILFGLLALILVIYSTSYRYQRIEAFLKSGDKTQTIGYQTNQAKIAIGSGGLFGVGFGKSATKYKYLPESIGDSIFAVIAQELGFIGALSLISVFFVMLLSGFAIAKKCGDSFARYIVISFITIIGLQTFIHIAAISGLIPLTGVPLPFISYGGTSLAVFLTMQGIIVNISKYV